MMYSGLAALPRYHAGAVAGHNSGLEVKGIFRHGEQCSGALPV